MRFLFLPLLFVFNTYIGLAQSFTSYLIGSEADVNATTLPGTVLAGGAGDSDAAMIWMLERAGGGDVVVLRASGTDGYNNYFFEDLGVSVNSVETIVFNTAEAAEDDYVIQQIENAECLFIAGGDQWDYISYWKDSGVEAALNYLINTKGVTIGGTSAGMAIQGDAYFSAENGTVYSDESLMDPYNEYLTIGYNDFLQNEVLNNTITDTHFDNPDRKGRLTAFMARLLIDDGIMPFAIASEEFVAVCIDENNIARVFGEFPDYDDYAYFVQLNYCNENLAPEVCEEGVSLTWLQEGAALKVLKVAGDVNGTGSFNLNDRSIVEGSTFSWEDWSVNEGVLQVVENSEPLECDSVSTSVEIEDNIEIQCYPNPVYNTLLVKHNFSDMVTWSITDISGRQILFGSSSDANFLIEMQMLSSGIYIFRLANDKQHFVRTIEKK